MEVAMTENEYSDSERRKNFGHFIECIRYTYGINQVNFAKILDVAQSSISKIENGDLTLTAFQWCDLAQNLNLPIETIKNCYLDNRTTTIINSVNEENGYEVSNKYAENKCIKVRYLLPFIRFMDLKMDKSFFDNFLMELSKETKNKKSTFLKRSFFCNLDNQVNLLFFEALIQQIKDFNVKYISSAEISYFSRFYNSHGFLAKAYEKEKNQINVLKYFIQNFPKYQGLMINEIIDQTKDSLTFSSVLHESLSENYFSSSNYFKDFTAVLFENEIQNISLINSGINKQFPPVLIKKYGNWNKLNSKVTFVIKRPVFS